MRESTANVHADPAYHRRLVRLKRSKLTQSAYQQGFDVCFACDREKKEKSYRLVYRRYREVGLLKGPSEGMWYTVFHALPSSQTAVALLEQEDGSPISTATFIEDSPLGLPSDSIYKDKIDELRNMGRRVAEISCLAALPLERARNAFLHVFRLIGLYGIYKEVDDIVISVHPKHTQFYEDILLFEPIGEMRYYPYLKDAPAILEHLDMRTAPKKYVDTFSKYPPEGDMSRFMLGDGQEYLQKLNEMMEKIRCPDHMPYADFFYFFVERKPIWQGLDQDQKNYFESIYPGLTAFIDRRLCKA